MGSRGYTMRKLSTFRDLACQVLSYCYDYFNPSSKAYQPLFGHSMPYQAICSFLTFSFLLLAFNTVAQAEMQAHPSLPEKADRLARIALVPPHMHIYEIGPYGTLEAVKYWEIAASMNVHKALSTEFVKREHLTVIQYDPKQLSASQRETYEETLLLYDLVSASIVRHAFPSSHFPLSAQPLFFPEKAHEFTYSLGKEVGDFASDVDALLLVGGFDQHSSADRVALRVAGAFLGQKQRDLDMNRYTVALVDAKTGDILWFSHTSWALDLREYGDAATLAKTFMRDLPILGKTP